MHLGGVVLNIAYHPYATRKRISEVPDGLVRVFLLLRPPMPLDSCLEAVVGRHESGHVPVAYDEEYGRNKIDMLATRLANILLRAVQGSRTKADGTAAVCLDRAAAYVRLSFEIEAERAPGRPDTI